MRGALFLCFCGPLCSSVGSGLSSGRIVARLFLLDFFWSQKNHIDGATAMLVLSEAFFRRLALICCFGIVCWLQ